MVSTDVFVVGGGPAGLAAAIAARQHGLRVMVADCFRPPIDKACGEGLMPGSAAALKALGVDLEAAGARVFRGIRFVGPDNCATAEFPGGGGVAIRRTVLHERLVERARQLGVEMRWGARVSGLVDELPRPCDKLRAGSSQTRGRTGDLKCLARIDGDVVRTNWVIGADGQNSQVRRWAGLSAGREPSRRIGLRQHFRVAPWSEFVEVYWGDEGQMYVTPVGSDEVGVALLTKKRAASFDAELEKFAALAARLQSVAQSTTLRGAATITRRLRSVCRGRVALIGDASGSVDAITGDGLAISFHQAVALGDALAASDLRRYQRAHRQIMARPRLMGRAMLLMDRSRRLRARALRAFAANPRLLQRLLALHVGDASVSESVSGAMQLGWELLRAA